MNGQRHLLESPPKIEILPPSQINMPRNGNFGDQPLMPGALIWIDCVTRLLSQIGLPRDLGISGRIKFLQKFGIGVEVKEEQRQRVIILRYQGKEIKICPMETYIFPAADFSFSLLTGGIMIIPNADIFAQAGQKGIAVGSFESTYETAVALPGSALKGRVEMYSLGYSFMDDCLYPISTRPPLIWHGTETKRFYEGTLFQPDCHPVGILANPTTPILVEIKRRQD